MVSSYFHSHFSFDRHKSFRRTLCSSGITTISPRVGRGLGVGGVLLFKIKNKKLFPQTVIYIFGRRDVLPEIYKKQRCRLSRAEPVHKNARANIRRKYNDTHTQSVSKRAVDPARLLFFLFIFFLSFLSFFLPFFLSFFPCVLRSSLHFLPLLFEDVTRSSLSKNSACLCTSATMYVCVRARASK